MSAPTFVHIASMPYSGSTLLTLLMGAHPEIASVGVMIGLIKKNPDEYLCSCRKRLRDCEFWQAVGAAMRARGYAFDHARFEMRFEIPAPGRLRKLLNEPLKNGWLEAARDVLVERWPGQRGRFERVGERNRAFVEAVLEVTGKRVFVDASKMRMRVNHLRRHLGMDLRVVHLVRDARGWVNSSLWHNRQAGRSVADLRRPSRRWVQGNLAIARQLAAMPPGCTTTVRYEALCRDVPGTTRQLFEFCGVDPAVDVRGFREVTQHVIGNRMRLESSAEIRLDERWRRSLDERQLQTIEAVAGQLNRSLGNG